MDLATDTAHVPSSAAQAAVPPGDPAHQRAKLWHDRLFVVDDEYAEVAGIINAGYGRLVDLAVLSIAERHDVGPGLVSSGQYLAWKTGVSKATADRIVRIARRCDDLPYLCATLRTGEISLDQADVVAQLASARYDHAATDLAKVATVQQLRTVLAAFRDPDDTKRPKRAPSVSVIRDDEGATIIAKVSNETADRFEQAMRAMTEDLYRQREGDARNAVAPNGDRVEGSKVEPPTAEETLDALCETSLRAGEALHPGAERYLLSYHLHTDADGRPMLTDDRGRVVGDGERRRILCDGIGEAVQHDDDGIAISVGRKIRVVSRKLRRTILFRDRHTCAVPGCDATVGLEIHHLVHWEDGGSTNTSNLITLCGRHHRAHHQDLLRIDGNADLAVGTPGAVVFTTPDRRPIPATTPPKPVLGPDGQQTLERLRRELDRRVRRRRAGHRSHPAPYASTPVGERIDRRTFHLAPDPPPHPEPASQHPDRNHPLGGPHAPAAASGGANPNPPRRT